MIMKKPLAVLTSLNKVYIHTIHIHKYIHDHFSHEHRAYFDQPKTQKALDLTIELTKPPLTNFFINHVHLLLYFPPRFQLEIDSTEFVVSV